MKFTNTVAIVLSAFAVVNAQETSTAIVSRPGPASIVPSGVPKTSSAPFMSTLPLSTVSVPSPSGTTTSPTTTAASSSETTTLSSTTTITSIGSSSGASGASTAPPAASHSGAALLGARVDSGLVLGACAGIIAALV